MYEPTAVIYSYGLAVLGSLAAGGSLIVMACALGVALPAQRVHIGQVSGAFIKVGVFFHYHHEWAGVRRSDKGWCNAINLPGLSALDAVVVMDYRRHISNRYHQRLLLLASATALGGCGIW